MRLPYRERAFIPRAKLTEYLLSLTHAAGKSKARFFRSVGYGDDNVALLEGQLLVIARFMDVVQTSASEFGVKYIIQGALHTPVGSMVNVQTVWIVEPGENRPRFVTAYPV